MATIRATLTDARLARLKPGDTISEGQGLRAWKRGARSPVTFTLQKRVRGEAKGRTFTLGNWPDVSIDDARAKASRFRKLCGDGVNPETVEREAFAAQSASQTTLRQYTERFLAQPAPRTGRMRRPNTIRDYWSTLNVVVPHLLDTAIRNISPGQIEKAYHAARDQGAVEFAKLFHRSMQAIVNDAMKTTAPDGKPFITRDPLENISKFPKVARRREAYLTAREVRIAIRAGFDRLFRDRAVDFGLVTQNNAMLVAVYTGLRISEVLSLKVSDVHRIGSSWLGDEVRQPFLSVRVGKKNPASGELTTVSHYLPLVPTLDMIVTMQLLCRAVWLSKREGRWDTDYLFPSPRKAGNAIGGVDAVQDVWVQALETDRNGYDFQQAKEGDAEGSFSAHWLRHTFETLATGLGFSYEESGRVHLKAPPSALATIARYDQRTSNAQFAEDIAAELEPVLNAVAICIRNYPTPRSYREESVTGETAQHSIRIGNTQTSWREWRRGYLGAAVLPRRRSFRRASSLRKRFSYTPPSAAFGMLSTQATSAP